MKQYLFPIAIAALSSSMVSCDDFLDQYSQDLVVAKSIQELNELLIGDVYLRSYSVDRGMSQDVYGFVNLLDDDIATVGTKNKGNIGDLAWSNVVQPMYSYFTWQQDVRDNYGATSRVEDNLTWNRLYNRIANANNIIDIVDDMPRTTDEDNRLYHRVKGEAHFLRGQFYFALANLYGHAYRADSAAIDLCVPLKLTPHVEHDKDKKTQFERASVKQVFDQIVADLTLAHSELTLSPQVDRFRLHRASAEAVGVLLSRVHLYRQDWAAAEAVAKKVMESPYCNLTTLAEMQKGTPILNETCREIFFSQGPNFVAPKNEKTSLSANPGDFCVSRDLYDTYTEEDVRKTAYFAPNATSDSIRLTNKYQRGMERNHVSDAFALRASEAYLNYAEACAMQGKEAEANMALAALRKERIIGYETLAYTGADLVREIREERRRELCFEGQRWFDLRRYQENKAYPFTKEIVHEYHAYSNTNSYVTSHKFVLRPGDGAYTFAIPTKVLEFDKMPMPNNIRPIREEEKIEAPLVIPGLDDIEDPSDSTSSEN